MDLLKYSQLPPDGFAGVRMREIVKDRRLFGAMGGLPHASGIGNLVYIADAHFVPHGDTRMHPHVEIDIVTLVLKGRIRHEGSLGDGTTFNAYDVQIQRAGGVGLIHNEVNPDSSTTHLVQIWLLPEQRGLPPDYRVYQAPADNATRVYGGAPANTQALSARTCVDIVRVPAGGQFSAHGLVNLYVAEGHGRIDNQAVEWGDFAALTSPGLRADSDCTLIVISHEPATRPHLEAMRAKRPENAI